MGQLFFLPVERAAVADMADPHAGQQQYRRQQPAQRHPANP